MEDSKRGLVVIIVMNLIIIHTFATWDEKFDKGYQEEEITIVVEIDFGSLEFTEEVYETSGNLDLEYVNDTWIFVSIILHIILILGGYGHYSLLNMI